jgi:hypothetical protein
VIETLPLDAPQNEFVSEAFEQLTAFVGTAAGAAATGTPWRTQLRQTCGWSATRRVCMVPALVYATTP